MPATLMALRDAGWRVVNVACGLGRPAQHQRRRGEVEEACRRAGFDLLVCDPPLPLSAGDDLAAAEDTLVELLAQLLPELAPALVCAPSPHDGHHAHELVGRAARRALEAHPGSGAAALALGRVGRSPVPDADLAVRPGAAGGDPARARRARLGARAAAARPAARGARGAQRRRRRGARARLGARGRPGGRARGAALRGGADAGGVAARRAAALRRRGADGIALGAADRLVADGGVARTPGCAARSPAADRALRSGGLARLSPCRSTSRSSSQAPSSSR